MSGKETALQKFEKYYYKCLKQYVANFDGEVFVSDDSTWAEILDIIKSGAKVVENAQTTNTKFGILDINRLNDLKNYDYLGGNVDLARDIEILINITSTKGKWIKSNLGQIKIKGSKQKGISNNHLKATFCRMGIKENSDSMKGLEGYISFADIYYSGNMKKAFQLASALCGLPWIEKQGWGKQLLCKTSELDTIKDALQDDLLGLEGYIAFANDHADGDMHKAFQFASALRGLSWIKNQGWGKTLSCKTSDLDTIKDALQDDLLGLEGYIAFANDCADGDMFKAFKLASALRGFPWIEKQGWGSQLICKTSDLDNIKKALQDDSFGLEGYIAFANDHADGDMHKAFKLVSALRGLSWIEKQKWGNQLLCKTNELDVIKKALRDDLVGLKGYIAFANDHADGDMQKAFQLASALRGLPWIGKQGWGNALPCKTSELDTIKKALRNNLIGLKGYIAFANDYTDENMHKAFQFASALRGLPWIEKQGWGNVLSCKTSELDTIKDALQDDLLGLKGYIAFANDHANGDMHKAFQLASALRGFPWIEKQKWGNQLLCKTNELDVIKKALQNNLLGLEGYIIFADTHADGDMHKAFQLASALRGLPWIKKQGWGNSLPCKTSELDTIKDALQDDLLGLEGYIAFANDHADGDMNKAFQLASALRGISWIEKQKWSNKLKCKTWQLK